LDRTAAPARSAEHEKPSLRPQRVRAKLTGVTRRPGYAAIAFALIAPVSFTVAVDQLEDMVTTAEVAPQQQAADRSGLRTWRPSHLVRPRRRLHRR
jgi:hypothetical protein